MSGIKYKYIILIAIMLLVVVGCSRPIVRPDAGLNHQAPGMGAPSPFAEQPLTDPETQMMQTQLRPVYFDYDSYTLSPDAQAALQFNSETLKRAPQFAVVSEGHCDERGTAEYNLALGDRRARAVVDYLITLGLPANRFSVVSYGSELPEDPAHNEQAWSKNRRVYLRVSRQ
jgi:peptidoglycan-associated lipoprotein